MALTISTGFVVDDAIVVIENITRYLEQGISPFHAALKGAAEIGSTVMTMSISLVAVFIPLLHDGRHRGAAVPRVCGDAFGRHRRFHGDLADGHAHDVRPPAAAARRTRLALPRQRARLHLDRQRLRPDALRGAAPLVPHAAGSAGHHRAERVSVHPCAQGLFPAAGQRPPDGPDSGRPGHFLPGHGPDPAAGGGDRRGRSGGRYRQRFHRRRPRRPPIPAACSFR